MKVIERIWWRLLSVSDEGYSKKRIVRTKFDIYAFYLIPLPDKFWQSIDFYLSTYDGIKVIKLKA
jgi:hypothetical protein